MDVKASILRKAVNDFQAEDYGSALKHYEKFERACPELAHTVVVNKAIATSRLNGDARIDLSAVNVNIDVTDDVFDVDYYLDENPDVKAAGVDPEGHYYSAGEREGRKPNRWFDPSFYYKLNADVREAEISAFQHYKDFGKAEGRLGCSPVLLNKRKPSNSRKPLLFVGHDGILAGSEIVLLEVVRWFYNHTNRRIKMLLLAPGPVADRYAEFADIYVLPKNKVDHPGDLKSFLSEDFEFAYLNTVVSGKLFSIMAEHDIKLSGDVVAHIHEMEKVLATFPDQMQQLLGNAKSWISASPASSKTLLETYNIPQEALTTVPAFINPVARKEAQTNELQAQARKKLRIGKDSFVVAGCGTVYWRKGTDLFVEAARALKKKTDKPIEFVWLGHGPDRRELESSLTEDEKKWIHFAGNRNDANRLLAVADVFFMSSREDPFPLVVLESAQHGIPAICFTPATGITAFVEEDAGICVPSIDAGQAADALYGLLENPARRKSLGDRAREKLFAQYTTEQQNLKIYKALCESTSYQPSVSVVVPFYNHEKFIEERLDSILGQSIKDIEIIALDDCSTDQSVERVKAYLSDDRFSLYENELNSGSPFKQWEKGVSLASAPVVWIAEGDDTCDSSFLETLLSYFDDPMVNIASAKTEIIDEHGTLKPGALDPYLEMAYPEKFSHNYIKDGFLEVNEQLGAMCTLVNASGLLIRKSAFGKTLKDAQSFKMCGDWLIYLECLKGGKIAHDVSTRNYFRRHSASQVHKVEGTDVYFKERYAITDYVVENYPVSQRMLKKAFGAMDHEWQRFRYKHEESAELEQLYSKNSLKDKARYVVKGRHVAFYVHGMTFSKGGIERLAAQLANHLVENGWKVTIFCRLHPSKQAVYPLYESVRVQQIFDETNLEPSVSALNKALAHSDIDVFVPMLSEWLFDPIVDAAQNTGVRIIASEHNDPWKIEELWWDREKRIQCFQKVDTIHLLLNKFSESVPEELREKVVTIPNGSYISEFLNVNSRERIIVSVGRLERQKRFDRLIASVCRIQNHLRAAGFKVHIYGDGSLRFVLDSMIDELGVGDLIFLKGLTSDVESVYERASFFVLPSEFEGFGMVIVEAMSKGLPVVAFQECNGANEIIENSVCGILADSDHEFDEAIVNFSSGIDNQVRFSAHSRSKAYSLERFYCGWRNLLEGEWF